MKSCASRDLGGNAFGRDPDGTEHHATVEVQAEVLRSLAVQECLSGCNGPPLSATSRQSRKIAGGPLEVRCTRAT